MNVFLHLRSKPGALWYVGQERVGVMQPRPSPIVNDRQRRIRPDLASVSAVRFGCQRRIERRT